MKRHGKGIEYDLLVCSMRKLQPALLLIKRVESNLL